MIMPRAKAGTKAEFPLGPWEKGIDEKTNPGSVPGNALIAANNVLLDEVPGLVVKRWGNKNIAVLPSGNPPKYGYNFKKNDGTEYLLLSDGAKLYVTTDLITITELVITSAAGATVVLDDTGYIQFETAESKCWITNGIDFVMWFDGTNLVLMDREYGAGVTATADSSTGTTIVDADLISGHGNDWWKFRKVVITSGAQAGKESIVTGFVEATGTLTFAPEIVGLTGTITYKVGLVMPKARIIRYGMDTMFLGGTSENRSEIRFNRTDNPDDGSRMSLDNPSAWPTNYQLSITQDDGDQVWTFSPVYRNRILVTKGVAIYRLEPSATYVYEPVLVSQDVGCRYPDAWAVKDNLLHFMGNERSGILDLYVTDMVSVNPGLVMVALEGRIINVALNPMLVYAVAGADRLEKIPEIK